MEFTGENNVNQRKTHEEGALHGAKNEKEKQRSKL